MRGKDGFEYFNVKQIRITPAYAGKSEKGYDKFTEIGDHPRLCGEKVTIRKSREYGIGSPPPMRGKVSGISSRLYESRITPAYAGKR